MRIEVHLRRHGPPVVLENDHPTFNTDDGELRVKQGDTILLLAAAGTWLYVRTDTHEFEPVHDFPDLKADAGTD